MDPFFFSLVVEPKGKPKSLIHDVLFCRSTFDSKAIDTLETRNGFSNLRLFLFATLNLFARLFYLFFDPSISVVADMRVIRLID